MKRWVLLVAFFTYCSLSCGYSSHYELGKYRLAAAASISDTSSYFVLSNGMTLKVFSVNARWRTLGEWWSGEKLIPERYEFSPQTWLKGAKIDIFSKPDHLDFNQEDATNKEDLERCTYLLQRVGSDKVLFAMKLDLPSFLECVFSDAYNKGHHIGYDTGYSIGYDDGKNCAHLDYRRGFDDGYAQACEEFESQEGR